jgi:ankyrin repeat protein
MSVLLALFTALALAQTPASSKAEQLQDAARKGDAATVKRLLDEGLDVNTKFRYNATALFFACDAGNVDVVRLLIDRGADLNLKDTFYGFTPLMLAASPARKKTPAHTEIAKLLIAKGAAGKEDAMMAAIDDGDAGLVQAVLDSGGVAPAKLTDALEAAKTAKKTEIVALLEKAGAKPAEVFKIDPALLAKYAGTYRGPQGDIEVAVDEGNTGLTIGPSGTPAAQRPRIVPKDNTTFRGVNMGGTTFGFDVSGDKVTGFRVIPPQGSPIVFTRVEKQ